MADLLIAGGGIAGSSLAIMLARRGVSVEIFERSSFPKEKVCGEGLMPSGVAVLERMGLAEAVGGAPFRGVRYHLGAQTCEGPFPLSNEFPAAGRGQRRRELDKALFDAAVATSGVIVHTGVNVDGPLVENGRVCGLVVQGEPRRASLLIAADGIHSHIRHSLHLDVPAKLKRIGARCHFRLRKDPPSWVDVFVAHGHELYVTPLPDREILVAALADAGSLREPIEQAFHRWCSSEPELAARLEEAEQITPLTCVSPLAGRARRRVMPGLVLLGDAAGFVDPITGGGMSQALMSAELLASYLPQSLERGDEWLLDFDRRRQRMLRDYQRLTVGVLWLSRHPTAARAALSLMHTMPTLLSHLVGVSAGMRPLLGVRRQRAAGLLLTGTG